MIHPITPFGIAGVIWYQGESNVSTHGSYRKLFTRMIDGKSVVVSSPEVPSPAAVRFAFTCDAIPNLFTAEGLPVNLFRTDR